MNSSLIKVESLTSFTIRIALTVVSFAIVIVILGIHFLLGRSQRRHCTNERNQDNY